MPTARFRSARARVDSINDCAARGSRPPFYGSSRTGGRFPRGRSAGPDHIKNLLHNRLANWHSPHQFLSRQQLRRVENLFNSLILNAGCGEEYFALGIAVGISDIDSNQKTVELRFRQRVGAFEFNRILSRQHMERPRVTGALLPQWKPYPPASPAKGRIAF